MIATGRGADKKAAALRLGAEIAVDAQTEDFVQAAAAAGGVDVILDMVGGDYTAKNLEALRFGGRLVQIAFQAGGTVEVDLHRIMRERLTLTGSMLRNRPADEKARLARAVEATVWPWIAAGPGEAGDRPHLSLAGGGRRPCMAGERNPRRQGGADRVTPASS